MAKFNPYRLTKEEREKLLNEFFMATAALEDLKEVRNFFKDLLSESELVMLARRLQIARMLIEGFNCEEIRNKLGVGFDNIIVVSKWLRYGRNGYLKAIERLDRLEDKEWKKKVTDEDKYDPFSWYNLKRRYRMYFWPEELFKQLDKIIISYWKKKKKEKGIKKMIRNRE